MKNEDQYSFDDLLLDLDDYEDDEQDDLEVEIGDFFDQNKKYHELLSNIVHKSFNFLERKHTFDDKGKKWFAIGISIFCAAQYAIIIVLVFLMKKLSIPPLVIETLVTGSLIETFALITIMVKALFNGRADLEIIKAIQEVAASYKKSDYNSQKEKTKPEA